MTAAISNDQTNLLGKEIYTVDRYSNDSKSSKAKRVGEFLVNNKVVTAKLICKSAGSIALGTAIGAGVGAAAASVVCPPLVSPAAKAGAAAGAMLGIYASVTVHYVEFRSSMVYEKWKQKAIQENVYPIFEKYVSDHVPHRLICPYTLGLIKEPVRDSHGHYFEKSQIDIDMAANNKVIKCLHSQTPITDAEMVFAPEYAREVLEALKPAFDAAISDAVIVAGAMAFQENAIANSKAAVQSEIDQELVDMVSCKSSDEDLEKASQKMAAKAKTAILRWRVSK
jgi:hypothetical protein